MRRARLQILLTLPVMESASSTCTGTEIMKAKRHGYFVEMKRVGNPVFPPWCLRDCKQRYWTGSEWVGQSTKALRYSDEQDCKRDLLNLTFQEPPKKYVAAATIQLDPSHEFTIEELRDYLRRNFKWKMKDDQGISPLDTALFHVQINVDELQELLPEDGV